MVEKELEKDSSSQKDNHKFFKEPAKHLFCRLFLFDHILET